MLIALAVTLASCRASVDFRSPTPALVSSVTPLPVTLSNELRRLRARASGSGEKTTFKVGNLLQPLFSSRDGRAFLSLVASDMELGRSDSAWETRYSLVVSLQYDGASRRIEAEGQASSRDSASSAGRSAIEHCVGDVYAEVASVLGRPAR